MAQRWGFSKGLQDLGNGCWAYVQPDGGWGWSNAGLIVDGDETLLVDTLFDLKLTAEMLAAMRDAVPAARRIDTLVNTHINGDHTFGNQLVEGAKLLTTRKVSDLFAIDGPELIQRMTADPSAYGEAGVFMAECFAPFDFSGIHLPPADETFEGSLDLKVGDKLVKLIDFGPAHTPSDTLAFVPEDRTVFTGDLLFVEGHPAIWAGPVTNWVKACEAILDMDVETVVPGHGPICTKDEVRDFRDYLQFLMAEARKRYDAGMTYEQAANDISFGRFDSWHAAERTVANMVTIYGEFSGTRPTSDPVEIWGGMARYANRRRAGGGCTNPAHQH